MSPLIDLYIHGRGRGHGTRSFSVFTRLKEEGFRVRVYAGPGARSAFASVDDIVNVESIPVSLGISTLKLLGKRIAHGGGMCRAERPSVVVSDGDLPGIMVAKQFGIPSIAVGHGLVFGYARCPTGISKWPWYREGMKARLSSLGSDVQLAVNFCSLEPRSSSTEVVRPVFDGTTAMYSGDQSNVVVCYFRDNNGESVLRALVAMGFRPVVFSPKHYEIDGVEVREPGVESFQKSLSTARGVVSSAGSQLMSECFVRGIPHFALFSDGDDEQQLNVEMLRMTGRGDGASFSNWEARDIERILNADRSTQYKATHGRDITDAVVDFIRRFTA